MPREQVRCNICGVMTGQSQAKDHALTPLHARRKSELEQDLAAVGKERYDMDSSVVSRWAGPV